MHKTKSGLPPESKALLLIQLLFGLVWLKSGFGKFTSPFVETLSQTLTKFASNNPLAWYKQFLLTATIPNATLFAQLTRWGELTAGVILLITALTALFKKDSSSLHSWSAFGVAIGFFLNLQFGLASFWTSPANETVNLVMGGVQLILFIYHLKMIKKSAKS